MFRKTILGLTSTLLIGSSAFAQTVPLASNVVAWGNAAKACLERPTNAAGKDCSVVLKDDKKGLKIYCSPPVSDAAQSVATGCDKEATEKVKPATWVPPVPEKK